MAFSFQNIKYGWVALASITLTGTTIYIANNTRQRVQQIDVVEIVVGAYERCLATVYPEDADLSDDDKRYGTSPFEVIRNWVDSDGVTNIVTNAIGWTVDRELLVAVDSVIYDLIPHYLNTNFAATDMLSTVRLTVTGVWDTLQIGDKTNLFSRSPERIPNAATYGGYPWRIYEEDLVERYKVLNLLKVLAYPIDPDSGGGGSPANRWYGTQSGESLHGIGWYTYASAKAAADPFINGPGGGRPPACYSYATYYSPPLHVGDDDTYVNWDMANYGTQSKFSWDGFPTNQLTSRPHSFTVEIRDSPSSAASPEYESGVGEDWVLILAATNSWEASHESITYGSSSGPGWPVRDPTTNANTTITRGYTTITRTELWWGMVPTNNIGQYVWSSNVFDNFDYCILDYDR